MQAVQFELQSTHWLSDDRRNEFERQRHTSEEFLFGPMQLWQSFEELLQVEQFALQGMQFVELR